MNIEEWKQTALKIAQMNNVQLVETKYTAKAYDDEMGKWLWFAPKDTEVMLTAIEKQKGAWGNIYSLARRIERFALTCRAYRKFVILGEGGFALPLTISKSRKELYY